MTTKIRKVVLVALALIGLVVLNLIVLSFIAERNTASLRVGFAGEQCRNLSFALQQFASDCGRYPTADEGLSVLFTNQSITGWRGPYVVTTFATPAFVDPWGRRYEYEINRKSLRITSSGPDRVHDTEDDIKFEQPAVVR